MEAKSVIFSYCLASLILILSFKRIKTLVMRPLLGAWCQGIIFLLFSGTRIFKTPPVFDELNFVKIAKNQENHSSSILNTLRLPNFESFGGIWWTLESLSYKFWAQISDLDTTRYTILTLRFFSILLLSIFIGMLAKVVATRNDSKLLLPLMVGALPMAWWSGKLASPELPAACLLGIGVLLHLKEKSKISVLVLGLSAGFKVSAFPALLAYVIFDYWKNRRYSQHRKLYQTFRIFIGASLGFLVCNLYLITEPRTFLYNFRRLNPLVNEVPVHGSLLKEVRETLFHTGMHWDFVSNSGVLYWLGGPVAALGLLFFLLLLKQKKVFATSAIAFGVSALILNLNGANLFPWYYFPDICLMFALVSSTEPSRQPVRVSNIKGMSYLAAIITISASSLTSAAELQQGVADFRDYSQLSKQVECLQNSLNKYSTETRIFNMIKTSDPVPLSRINGGAAEVVGWISRPQVNAAILVTGGRARISLKYLRGYSLKVDARCGTFTVYEIRRG